MRLPSDSPVGGRRCPVCNGNECKRFPDVPYPNHYPFLPGGFDPMADQEFVIATERVFDADLERIVYSPGDKVPMADAVRYGLADRRPKGDRKKAPAESGAKKVKETR